MSPIVKENEVLTVTPESVTANSAAPAARPSVAVSSDAAKAQPVALEIPVTVNGARTIDGSDKREPFSEATQTVLVFGNGAVIRLTSSVAPGQLLFLTNEKTKKEVVCQVVKSKNFRNASGYVELEFTEPLAGFWGMRFPTDRMASAPANATPTAITTPSVASVPPVSAVAQKPVEQKVEQKPVIAPPPSATPVKPISTVPSTPVEQNPVSTSPIQAAPTTPKSEISVSSTNISTSSPSASTLSLPRALEAKPSTSSATSSSPIDLSALNPTPMRRASDLRALQTQQPPAIPVEKDAASEALKLETARLAEQLSKMQFSEPPAVQFVESAVKSQSTSVQSSVSQMSEKVIEFTKPQPAPSVPVAPTVPSASKTSFDINAEEVKIPAWLEPLARNSAAPASTQELIEREKSKHAAALVEVTEAKPEAEIVEAPQEEVVEASQSEVAAPDFGSRLLMGEDSSSDPSATGGSKKGLVIGLVAAGIAVAVAGGWWYTQQSPSVARPNLAAAASAPVSNATVDSATQPQTQNNLAAASAPLSNNPTGAPLSSGSVNSTLSTASSPVASNSGNKGAATPMQSPAASRNLQPAASQPKKPSLGEVRLATPNVTRSGSSGDGSESAPSISNDESGATQPVGAGLLAGNAKQPAAPAVVLPVGGDVKPARLLSSPQPSYPSLAKAQHVGGDVKIDALIDTTGRVTTMKIVSGPTLLQQAAMDALRNWKYQPATLDSKPVPMHLTVTIQFRLQQ